ncbi:hypothetical protein QJQ45_001209 [Haematococcus lacustris]|nr:hypothetical protein QJQ45_001209 [Haematococcus lacustris]
MSLVAQCLRGSGPVARIQSRIRLKARENKARRSRGKQREERRAEWKTQRRQVIKVPGGAVLRGCKKTKRKLLAHFQLRAGVHSLFRVIASLFVLRIFLTCLPAAMDMDWDSESEAEPEPEPEPEPAPAPPTLRPPSARLAARHPPPAAPTGPPMPLDNEDPVMLQQLQVFCMYFANTTFLTPYNQLQRRLGRARQNKHFILKPAFDDPSNQELLAKLQRHAATLHGKWWCLNTDSPELQAAQLDKAHVNDLIEEAAKQRRLLALEEGDSLQDTVPLPCRMRHAVHVCRCLEQWQQPPTPPVPGQPKRGGRRVVSAASGLWDPATGQLVADQLCRWKLAKGQVKHGSGMNNALRDTERWLAPIKPHLQHLAAASSASTSLEANLKHITVTLATWDAVWEVYLDLKWAQQRLRLYGAQDRTLEQFFKKLEEDMEEVPMQRHGRAKQLVVFFGAATIGTRGGWGADAVLRACCKVVCRPRGTDQRRGRVVLVDELSTPRKPPQAPHGSQEATPAAASEPGPSTPLPAKRSKRTKAEPAAEPTKGKGKAAKAKPAPQPGRWLDRDCNAALNMQRIGESKWRPLELCYWPEQGKLPAKGKEYPGLGYKRLRDKPPKAQQQQPAVAQ